MLVGRGERPRAAAPRAHSLQQPRRRRQRRHDARQHARARRPPRAFHASAVPQLRRRARQVVGSAARQSWHEYVNAHPEITGDVGQVMFGHATTLTADGAVEYLLHTSTGRKWVNVDIELETGCGIVPYTYKDKAAVASLQWVVGLELFLLSNDPWRMVLSTDHPNGGSFMSYPDLIRLLMDRAYRDEKLKSVNQKMLAGSALADGIAREYTLQRDRDHHARGSRTPARPGEQGSPGRRRRCGRYGLCARRRLREDVFDAAIRAQGGHARRRGRAAPPRAGGAAHLTCVRGYDDAVMRDLGQYFDRVRDHRASRTIRSPACASARRHGRRVMEIRGVPSKTPSPRRSACAARA